MALVQTGVIISSIKGSVGGTTFSQTRAGLTAKRRSVGKRLPNSAQLAALNNSMSSTVAWNALSSDNKIAFNEYALANEYTDRYGVTKPLTGYQFYKQLSQASNYFTSEQLVSPPSYSIPDALPTFTVFINNDVIRIDWSTPIDTDVIYIQVFASAPTKGLSVKQRGAYKQLDVRDIDYSDSFFITSPWSNAFGMSYLTAASNAIFNINVQIFAIKKSSFNSGIAQFATGSLD